MNDDIKALRMSVHIQTAAVFAQSLIFLLALYFVVTRLDQKLSNSSQAPSVSQVASPVMTTNVQAPDEMTAINEKAITRGYYFKEEFAEKMDVSPKTVDRWRTEGKIESGIDDNGRVAIPLDAVIGE